MLINKKIIPAIVFLICIGNMVSAASKAETSPKLQESRLGKMTVLEQKKNSAALKNFSAVKSDGEQNIATIIEFEASYLGLLTVNIWVDPEEAAYPLDVTIKLYRDKNPLVPGPKQLVYSKTFAYDNPEYPISPLIRSTSTERNHDDTAYAFLQGRIYLEADIFNRSTGEKVGGTNGILEQGVDFTAAAEDHMEENAVSSAIGSDTRLDAFFFTKYGFKKLQAAGVFDKLLLNAYLNYRTTQEVKAILDGLGVEYTLKTFVGPPDYYGLVSFKHFMETPYQELCSINLASYDGQLEEDGKLYTKNKYSDIGKSFAIYIEEDNCFSVDSSDINEARNDLKQNLIQALKEGSAAGEFVIYDINGRKVKQGSAKEGDFSLGGLPPGNYIISVVKDGKSITRTIGFTGN